MSHDSKLSRRNFISTSLGSLAGAGLAAMTPGTLLAQERADTADAPSGEIIYRTLGRTGMKVPIVSMGVMNADMPEVVKAAYELGMRHFDTASRYQYGRNEEMVGDVINRMKVRDKVIIATKEIHPGTGSAKSDKAKLIEMTEESLKRLKTDYVDILYIHAVNEAGDFTDEGSLEAMTQLKKDGKIRAAGVSTHGNMAGVIEAVVKGGFYDVVLTAINVAMADNTKLLQAIASAAKAGVGIVAMKTQAGGGSRLPNPDALKDYTSTVIATACLKWVMRNENITTAIPGFTNFQHMREDFSVATNLDYSEEEQGLLKDNKIQLGLGYCHQCRECEPSCPHNVDIPTLMRTHMYAAQYGNFHEAREAISSIAPGRGLGLCTSCESCAAACANQVDIGRSIDNLKAIYA